MNDLKLDIAKKHFEIIKSVDENGNETWSARKLMERLGYVSWDNFFNVIKKAATACKNSGIDTIGQFHAIMKPFLGPNGATMYQKDYILTRYACYLIAQNGDSTKKEIAWAQTYFAIQTRKQEVAGETQQALERLTAREKLSKTEKKLAGVLYEQGVSGKGIGIIRARGDKALFGGYGTNDMKRKLAVPDERPLADFLPTVTIKAKDLTAEMTSFKTKEKGLENPEAIGTTHEGHNKSVRQALVSEGIYPERLPAEEDIKKLERRINKEAKSLPKPAEKPLKLKGTFTDAIEQIAKGEEIKKNKHT